MAERRQADERERACLCVFEKAALDQPADAIGEVLMRALVHHRLPALPERGNRDHAGGPRLDAVEVPEQVALLPRELRCMGGNNLYNLGHRRFVGMPSSWAFSRSQRLTASGKVMVKADG